MPLPQEIIRRSVLSRCAQEGSESSRARRDLPRPCSHTERYQREMFPFERFHAWNGGGKFTVYSKKGKEIATKCSMYVMYTL